MTMDTTPRSIADQAARYYVKRVGESAAERQEREAWLAADVRHAQAFDEVQRLWERLGDLRSHPGLQALKAADLAALKRSRWPSTRRLFQIAATMVLLLLGGLYVASRMGTSTRVSYATQVGERRTEVLEDGSQIVLNTDSRVDVQYRRGQRDIALQRGEAQFDVAHDATRPFVVHVGDDTVTALGTRFQVRREAEAVAVTLLKGSVDVMQGQTHRVLQPNERADFSSRTRMSVRMIDPIQAEGWLDGWLRFRNASLSEVVAEANRYTPRKLQLGDAALATLRVSGNFRTGDNASIASGVALILPVRVDDRGDTVVLHSK